MAIDEKVEEKFKEAYIQANRINASKRFIPTLPQKSEKPRNDSMLLDGRTLLISEAAMDVIDFSFTKDYVDMDMVCLGPNLVISRHFHTNPERLASRQAQASKPSEGGLLGPGWVLEYETCCIYTENNLSIIWTDHKPEHFEKLGYHWLNKDGNSLSQVTREDILKNEITVKKNGLFFTYRFDGRLKHIRNHNYMGNELHYIGDTRLIEKIVSDCGKALNFRYKENKIVEISDHTGRTVRYQYEEGKLYSAELANGGIWRHAYDSSHNRLVQVTDPNKNIDFAVRYDKKGIPIVLYKQNNLSWRISHDVRSKIISFSLISFARDFCEIKDKSAGKERNDIPQFTIKYDRTNLIRAMVWSDGRKYQFHYDERGNLIAGESSTEGTVQRTYDQYGRMIYKDYPDGSWEQWAWNDKGSISKYVRSNGYERLYEYDKRGNLTEMRTKLNKGLTGVEVYDYDEKGRRIKAQDANKNSMKFIYKTEVSVFPEKIEYPNGFVLERAYDELSRLRYEMNNGVETRWLYNYMDQQVQMLCGSRIEFRRYDYLGHLVEITLTSSGGHADKQRFGSGNKKYLYGYNENYDLTDMIYPSGRRQEMAGQAEDSTVADHNLCTYDFAGKVISRKLPSPKEDNLFCLCLYTYDKNQNLIQERISAEAKGPDEMPSLIVIDYAYDNRNNISHIHVNSGLDCKFYYKGIDRLAKQIRRINETTEHITLYEYNENGLLSAKIDLLDFADADVENMAIDHQNVSSISLKTAFSYDSTGSLTAILLPDGIKLEIKYDNDGCIITDDHTDFLKDMEIHLSTQQYGQDRPLAYQLLNEQLAYFETLRSMKPVDGILYDKFGRVLRRTFEDGRSQTFTYDLAENVASVTDGEGQTTAYQYNSINRLKKQTEPGGAATMYLYGLNGLITKEKQIQIEEQVL